MLAATVYACGKTFLWPTMLAVVSEQFPRGGAITIGAIGGVGMLSAGLLGGPGIGFEQDYYASENLKKADPAVYERYKAPTENEFLTFKTVGLDGAKVGVLEVQGTAARRPTRGACDGPQGATPRRPPRGRSQTSRSSSTGGTAPRPTAQADKPLVTDASLYGGRMALKLTAAVPGRRWR